MSWSNPEQPSDWQQRPPAGVPPYPPQQTTSGKAIAAFVLGICGFFVCPLVCSILAIVFGKQAQAEIEAGQGRVGGGGLATAAIVLGWVGVALVIAAALFFAIVAIGVISLGDELDGEFRLETLTVLLWQRAG